VELCDEICANSLRRLLIVAVFNLCEYARKLRIVVVFKGPMLALDECVSNVNLYENEICANSLR